MTNLSDVHGKIKSSVVTFLVVIVLLLLSAIIYLKFNSKNTQISVLPTPKPPAISQNPSQKQPDKFDFSNIETVAAPTVLSVYTANKYQIDLNTAVNIAQKFGYKTNPANTISNTTDGTQFTWADKDKVLSISQTTIRFKDATLTKIINNLSAENLQNTATDFVKSIPQIGQDVSLDSHKTAYFSVNGALTSSASSFADAQIVEFTYDKKLSGYPIFTSSINPSAIIIQLRKDGSIAQFQARIFNGFTDRDQYPILTLREAVENVKNNKGVIVNTYMPDKNGQALDLFRVKTEDIKLAKMAKISLAYYLPTKLDNEIQPIYIFEGNFTTSNNESGKIVIYLPALKNAT